MAKSSFKGGGGLTKGKSEYIYLNCAYHQVHVGINNTMVPGIHVLGIFTKAIY